MNWFRTFWIQKNLTLNAINALTCSVNLGKLCNVSKT